MELDDRLKKIATGMSVADAIDSYMGQLGEDQPFDPEQERKDELLAIVEVMFLMAAVDGEISSDEIQELRASMHALEDMQEVGGVGLEEVMKDLAQKLETDGWKARLEDAASRIRAPEARQFAFQLAAGVAFVDDFVAHAEAAAIDSLAKAFGFTREESQMLLQEVHETLFR
jgi:uncharacterized tellurite resistance protein B-like protein